MARKKKKVEAPPAPQTEAELANLIDFDEWYALRQEDIPPQHKKEILKADFKANKVGNMATMEQFDAALRKYGVKLD